MRILYINGKLIDLDSQTAIGIDLQQYDIKQPALNKVKISNSFSIPITNNNLSAIGWIGRQQNISNSIYGVRYCNYYVNNLQFIKNGRIRVTSVGDRIELYMFEKPDIWDTLKTVKWKDFKVSYYGWLDINKFFNRFSGTMNEFLEGFIDRTNSYLWLPYCRTNIYDVDYTIDLGGAVQGQFFTGGHFFTYIKTIFEYIEGTYSVNFFTDGNLS